MIRRRSMMAGKRRELPKGYTRLAWIDNNMDDTIHYIQIPQHVTPTEFILDAVYRTTDQRYHNTILGLGSFGTFSVHSNNANKGVSYFLNTISNVKATPNYAVNSMNARHTFRGIRNNTEYEFFVEDTKIYSFSLIADYLPSTTDMFNKGTTSVTWGTFYEAILLHEGKEILHLVPCLRDSDNWVGVFDTVKKRFYPSEKNTCTYERID